MKSGERSALATDVLLWCSMDATPHSTKEQHPVLKKALKGRTVVPKHRKRKSRTPICHASLGNNSEQYVLPTLDTGL